MARENELNNLIVQIYELGLDAETWPNMLDEIAGFYGCAKIAYMHVTHDDTQRTIAYFRHPEPDAPKVLNSLATYQQMPPGSDIWFELGKRPEASWEGAFLCSKHVPLNILLQSDHYNMVVKEAGCFDNLGMRVAENDDYSCYLSVYSDGPHRMFTDEDEAYHQALHPHIRRVANMQTRLGHATRMASLQSAALDMLHFAIIIVGARGKIAFANEAARILLLERNGLEERRGRLMAVNDEGDVLQQAISRACGVGGAPTGVSLILTDLTLASSLALELLPLDPGASADPFQRLGFERLALVVISDPEGRKPAPRDRLMIYFGLRPSEARVAELLLTGLSQREVAAVLQLSEGTVRWHVKNLMSKLGVRRESQLVMKLTAALPPIGGG